MVFARDGPSRAMTCSWCRKKGSRAIRTTRRWYRGEVGARVLAERCSL